MLNLVTEFGNSIRLQFFFWGGGVVCQYVAFCSHECPVSEEVSQQIYKISDVHCLSQHNKTRCVCETRMLSIKANSKDGLGLKEKHLDTSRTILSQEMLMCNMKAPIFII